MKWYPSSPVRTFEDDDGLVVYFSEGSGSTHLINEAAAFVLDLVTAGPVSTEQLLQQMASQVDDISEQELSAMLGDLLSELQAIDLIEAA